MKQNACISIDVDTLSSIYKGLGCTRQGGYTYIEFRTGLENLSAFFEQFNIKTTLFMVGNDFKYSANLNPIREIYKSGHEIANHSMTHPQGFRWLSSEEKKIEIQAMGQICKDATGEKPIGFRSPGWNIDNATIPILKKLGYTYDSSVFPTFLMPVMKFAHWRSMSRQAKPDRTTMGLLEYMFAPIRPYHSSLDALWKKGTNGLIEFPLSVTPILRIPFFATLLLFSGVDFYRFLFRQIRCFHLPVHFQMHLSDFVDYNLPELTNQMPQSGQGIYVPQALHAPLSKKLKLFKEIIELIGTDYNFLTLKQWAQRIEINR